VVERPVRDVAADRNAGDVSRTEVNTVLDPRVDDVLLDNGRIVVVERCAMNRKPLQLHGFPRAVHSTTQRRARKPVSRLRAWA
jgi:hypothetical protein